MNLLMATLFLFAQEKPKDPEPKERFCWESLELYEDSDFKKPMPADSDIMKSFQKKRAKYEKTVKEEVAKVFKQRESAVVECPKHKLEGSPLKQVDEKADVYHYRIKLAYSGFIWIDIYAKVEIYRGDKLICEFKDEKSVSIFRMADREARKTAIIRFGRKIANAIVDKTREAAKQPKK